MDFHLEQTSILMSSRRSSTESEKERRLKRKKILSYTSCIPKSHTYLHANVLKNKYVRCTEGKTFVHLLLCLFLKKKIKKTT
jgi:hypothetical protein